MKASLISGTRPLRVKLYRNGRRSNTAAHRTDRSAPGCAKRAKSVADLALSQLLSVGRALRQHFHEADAPRRVAAEEHAIGIGRIDVEPARIALRLGQRE